ncbi:MAG: helix-turn-helix domain-containing protein [Acetobacteraceae bacterium]
MSERPSLHRHLAAWRDRKGLSQEHVANILGVNKSTIHRWETGKRAVDLTDLQRLAEIYEIDALALLLSPNDLDLAERLNRAKAILTAIPADQADRWLAMGGDLAASKLPKMQQPD